MTLGLADLAACFEGVIPSSIATLSGDRTPNISCLSHVVQVDAVPVARSNQFFGKTVANLRTVSRAAILLVDSPFGTQYRLKTLFTRFETSGEVFDRVATHLVASSMQVAMADVMRLRAVDVFRVTAITQVPSEPAVQPKTPQPPRIGLRTATRIGGAVSDATELGAIVDAVLGGMPGELGCHAASVLLR